MHTHPSGMHERTYCLTAMEKIWWNGLLLMRCNAQIMGNQHIPASKRGDNTLSILRSMSGKLRCQTGERSRNLSFLTMQVLNIIYTGTTLTDLQEKFNASELQPRSQSLATTRLTGASSTKVFKMLHQLSVKLLKTQFWVSELQP